MRRLVPYRKVVTRFGSRSLDDSTSKADPDTGLKRTITNLLPFVELPLL